MNVRDLIAFLQEYADKQTGDKSYEVTIDNSNIVKSVLIISEVKVVNEIDLEQKND